MAKGKGWPVIGTVRRSKEGANYIKLADNVKIFVDGEELKLGQHRVAQLQDPRAKVEMLRDKGHIDEETASKRLEKLAELSFLRYEIVVPPPRD